MKTIDPPCMPKTGDPIEIVTSISDMENDTGWIPAIVTKVEDDTVFGWTLDDKIGFGFGIASYRRSWRFR